MGDSPAGTSVLALAAGGNDPSGKSAATEEWTAPATFRQFNVGDIYYNADPSSGVIKYVGYGTGAWASGGNMNQARSAMLGGGSQDSNIQAGGTNPGTTPTYNDECEEYNGSAWSEITEMNQARAFSGGSGANAEAVLIFGGRQTIRWL